MRSETREGIWVRRAADCFGVFEDISNLSNKLLRGSRRQMLSPSSAVFVRALLFRLTQASKIHDTICSRNFLNYFNPTL